MEHNIDMTNDRANVAFRGSRKDVWHRLGTEMEAGMSIEQWAAEAIQSALDAMRFPDAD